MTTTPEPDQVAEVLAEVAEDHHLHPSMNLCLGDTCGWRPTADRGSLHRQHGAHLATEQAAALQSAGLVVEGTEVEEWGVRFDLTDGHVDLTPRSVVEKIEPGHGVTGVRRARTRYPDRVTEWVAVDEEQP